MAHFAKLKEGNIVETVVVVSNEVATNEQAGIDFLKTLYKDEHGIWVQTSYNANFRKNYAGIGFHYDVERDAFIAPKPHDSWTLNEETCQWEAPIPYPNDGQVYFWNESSQQWELIP